MWNLWSASQPEGKMYLIYVHKYLQYISIEFLDTVWKFQEFSSTQILREIKFGHFEFQTLPF